MLVDSFGKALSNLMLPGIWKLFLLCLLAYVVGWFALSAGVGVLLSGLMGGAEGGFLAMLGTVGGGVVAWFLFPLLFPILISFFDDYMADLIEQRDYPQLPRAEPPFWPTFKHDAWFSVKAVSINLLLFPLYFIPLLGQLLYFGMNGYLLGMQIFRMCAGRRVSLEQGKMLQKQAKGPIVLAGAAIMLAATVPFLNLAAPVLGVATMLHLFHALNGTEKQQILLPEK